MTSRLFGSMETTIFTVMSALARTHGAINLGQGFPDEDGPLVLRERAARALAEGPNQYPPMAGLPELRAAIAAHSERFYGLKLNPDTDVLVTSGATEAIADCLFGLVNPGDEVIVFEPVYDSYRPMIELAGAKAIPVRLEPPNWRLSFETLERVVTSRTRVLLLNSPMNPCGKVFDEEELRGLADFCVRNDLVAVCDEVYEHLVFADARHIPLRCLPGMAERAVRIGSAGKTFALTGWKVGYVSGPAQLIAPIAKAHQFVTFTTAPALQVAVAEGLGFPDSYFNGLTVDLQAKRDLLADGLTRVGFEVLPAAGSYFLIASYAPFHLSETPLALCRRLTIEAGVAAIPLDAFYGDGHVGPYLRFCFCKRPEILEQAVARLERYLRR